MFSFRLPSEFVDSYATRPVEWGYPVGPGVSLGEITFLRTYSRMKPDGTKERWHEVCERVINGMYSIQKDHCVSNRLPWSDEQATEAAEEAFDRMFTLRWLPPGRGLWMMGTPLVNEQRNAAALQNCSFVSTDDFDDDDPSSPFTFLMEASMLGVGVGFDTDMAKTGLVVHAPSGDAEHVVIDDSREGWVDSVGRLLNSYLLPDRRPATFDYSAIRPAGTPIKGFGGTAAGAEPLIRLHTKLAAILGRKAGSAVDTELVADIGNLIGVCVVAGNVRRSAELMLGDADDEVFTHLKDQSWFPERNSYDRSAPGWGWMSNNTLRATVGMDYTPYVDNIATNGEPGFAWMDITRAYGRTGDAPDHRDHRAAGYNPCVTADTWVMTADGARQVRELIGVPTDVIVDGAAFPTSGFFATGTKPVIKMTFADGRTVRLTDDHQVLTADHVGTMPRRSWRPAGRLAPGDLVVVHDHRGLDWDGHGTFDDGEAVGRFAWAGPFTATPAMSPMSARASASSSSSASTATLTRTGVELATMFGVNEGAATVPAAVERASGAFTRGFLRAVFDTDATVDGSGADLMVRLAVVHHDTVGALQRMLSRLGVNSSGHSNPGADDPYAGQPGWELVISGSNLATFATQVGFADDTTRNVLEEALRVAGDLIQPEPFVATVAGIEPDGIEDVFDATVPGVHAFDANGLYVHNCSEQPLESFEMCTLVEVFLNRHDDIDDFLRTLKFAYKYGKTVTLLATHWQKTNAVMQRNRRIGCSISGLAGFADTSGLPALRDWMEQGYAEVRRWDRLYSEWLCVRESIRTTTVKPSGTVSIVAGATPGVHWAPGGKQFLRTIRFSELDPMVALLESAGYRVEDDVVSAGTKVVYFPVHTDQPRAERDVSIFEKIHLAAFAQRHWSDNAVSVTVSFDPDTEAKHVPTVLHMHEGALKAVSFLPSGAHSYPQMPYQGVSPDEYDRAVAQLLPVDLGFIYSGGQAIDASGEAFCTTDACELKIVPAAVEFEDEQNT
jgi:ribonucleotide reductase alpha subunit